MRYKYAGILFFLIILYLIGTLNSKRENSINKFEQKSLWKEKTGKMQKRNEFNVNETKYTLENIHNTKCFIPSDNSCKKINHMA